MSDIDEGMIANFAAMTDNTDRLTAIRYLENNNWDLGKAVENMMLDSAMQGIDNPGSSVPQMDVGNQGWQEHLPPRPDQIPEFDNPMPPAYNPPPSSFERQNPDVSENPTNFDAGPDGGIGFLMKFREKYGESHVIPDFYPDEWDAAVREC